MGLIYQNYWSICTEMTGEIYLDGVKAWPVDAPPKSQSNRADSIAVLLPADDGTGARRMAIRVAPWKFKRH